MPIASSIPAVPPAPAFREKAPWKMLPTARGSSARNTHSTPREAAKNNAAMAGTSFSVSLAAQASPPLATQNTSTPSTAPTARGGAPSRCGGRRQRRWPAPGFPMPREARQHPAPYTRAKGLPTVWMYPRAPGTSRCRGGQQVLGKDGHHPQQGGGPHPEQRPRPAHGDGHPHTPRMFPVPREPARAVVRAWKGLTLPRPRAFFRAAQGGFHPQRDPPHLEKPGADGKPQPPPPKSKPARASPTGHLPEIPACSHPLGAERPRYHT